MISIIIPTLKKNEDYLNLCINSIVEHTNFSFEILIAENGEGTDYPQGQCQAVNRVAKQAKGDWLFIVNDDMYFPYGWDKMIDFRISDCFSPNLVEPTEQGSAPPFLKINAGNELNFNRDMVNYFCLSNKDEKVEHGFNFPVFIKKSLWDKVGGYDEKYDPFGSNGDSDLQCKVVLAGVYPRRNRGVLVYHLGSKSGTQNPENHSYWQRNWDYFIEKWGFPRAENPWFYISIPTENKFHPDWEVK
jgi:GT2 family glycosyltransferase